MSRFARVMALLALAVYSLAMAHCDLEHIPGFEFLSCGQHQEAPSHQNKDCDMDGCSVVETGHYRLEEQQPLITFALLATPVVLLEAAFIAQPATVSPAPESASDLSRPWQFRCRTALPVRAPSLA